MAEFDEKFAECVRQFPVLYDKQSKDFKDKNKKQKAWENVSNTMGMKKEEAVTYFRNMRNRYSREKKKVRKVKVSGTGSKEVDEVKSELSDLFPYLHWLEPYIKERKTKTNFHAVQDDGSDSENEVSDVSVVERNQTPDPDGSPSDTSQSDTKKEGATSKSQTAWKFHKHTAKDAKKKKVDREDAEFELIKSLGESIAQHKTTSQEKPKDDNDIFSELIASQLKQLSPQSNIMVKMQISNLIYQHMMSPSSGHQMQQPLPTSYSHTPVMMQDQGNTYMSL